MESEVSEKHALRLEKRRERYRARRETICARERARRSSPEVRSREKAYRQRADVKARASACSKAYAAENRDKISSYQAQYFKDNRARLRLKARAWIKDNPERVRDYQRRYDASSKGQERRTTWLGVNCGKVQLYKATWYHKNKSRLRQRQNERERERRKVDPSFRLAQNLRARTRLALSRGLRNVARSDRHEALWGCSPAELVVYLEAQFSEGMSWANYGEWHVDHIRELCEFDLTAPEQQRAAFHFTNLRPLWAADNLKRPNRSKPTAEEAKSWAA